MQNVRGVGEIGQRIVNAIKYVSFWNSVILVLGIYPEEKIICVHVKR